MVMSAALPQQSPRCLCIDLETAVDDLRQLRKLAGWRPDTGASLVVKGAALASSLARLDELGAGAAFVLGHNIVRHDLPVLRALYPGLALHRLPVVDTLELSPIAFPQNPYHSLVKDYRLVRDATSDPLRDAQLALRLWLDEYAALAALAVSSAQELACHHYFLTRAGQVGVGSFFASLRGALPPSASEVRQFVAALARGKACPQQVAVATDEALSEGEAGRCFSYVLAWLRVSGGNSVLPPWLHLQFPRVSEIIRRLRASPCTDPACAYCTLHLVPEKELERYFGFAEFRSEPRDAGGQPLQERIVRAAYAGQSLLAILPTGGGKSICYQLPALSRYWQEGSLTIVISPLQSLMKDQVDNLVRSGIYSGATLNGMLTLPERRDVLARVRLGDVGILLVSPEQFRSRAFAEAIRYRQIAAWVFDEAHCLSRWGNDFRPDYLYVARFIRERHAGSHPGAAPVCCFTATAKKEVVADIVEHFRHALGRTLDVFDGGHERDNLHYEVLPVSRAEKLGLIGRLLEQELGSPRQSAGAGGAVVFTTRRRSAEEIDGYLKDLGWPSAHFHAGLEAGLKQDIQRAFIDGALRVIVATNAFGMGVDKSDVRLVLHAEIPGSLENYLQEAGRAGRDRREARCILLYDEEDVEAQFALAARSRLSRQDIANILRTLRRYSARAKSAEVVVTPGEILADDELETSIEAENPDADTKVRTAIAWLERAHFVERNENHTRVFPGCLKVASLAEAQQRLARAGLSAERMRKYADLVSLLINARADEGLSTDDLMLGLGATSEECIRMLQQLEQLGILSNDLLLTVLLRRGVPDASRERMEELVALEQALLALLPELAPEADSGDWQEMNLAGVCAELRCRTGQSFLPDALLTLLRSLARPFGDDSATRRAMFEVRVVRRSLLRLRLLRSWRNVGELAERRRGVALALLGALLGRLDERQRGVDLRVEVKLGELAELLRRDLSIGPLLKDEVAAIDAGLLYLHDNHVLILDQGKAVFRSAMTITVFPGEKHSFAGVDFAPLKEHYDERNFQIHVVNEYARLGLNKLSDALSFVLAYFALPKLDFIRHYFSGRKEMLERATTEESYRRVVEDLRHPLQQRLVAQRPDENRLILAGPGAGKTRVIVHRVAYLVRVLREAPASLIVLAFNRSAASEIRRRLHHLIANDACRVTVLTYHALALRLTGTSLRSLAENGREADFDALLEDALALLQGRPDNIPLAGDSDELRERLLAGYRHILIDEYQDIDRRQFDLISALAGRTLADGERKLSVLAVGDDDQNIYSFRGSSTDFIRRFQDDYQAKVEFLVDNHRSTANIIAAANSVIAGNAQRLKSAHPIRIDARRRREPPGGRWQALDPLAAGQVQVLAVPPDAIAQAVLVIAEVERLAALDARADWSDFALLARNRATLEPLRAWCESAGIACAFCPGEAAGAPRLHQVREGWELVELLRARANRLLRSGTLGRWFAARHRVGPASNPWLRLLRQSIDEIEASWGDSPVPASLACEALYEFGNEARAAERGRLTLSTVHGAKGREFRHVVMLDGGDWRRADEEERRLYYVGMTRARENLVLCQASRDGNPFTPALAAPLVRRSALPESVERPPALALRYCTLGLREVDIGFAGRFDAAAPVHRAIAALKVGDRLLLAGRRELRNSEGYCVGRLARAVELPVGEVLDVRVDALVRRTRQQSEARFQEALRSDAWWVVLATLRIAAARC